MPVGGIAGLFFIIPICVTMPPLEDVLGAPSGQVIPYIFHIVMGTPGGGLGLTFLVLGVTVCLTSLSSALNRIIGAWNSHPSLMLTLRIDVLLYQHHSRRIALHLGLCPRRRYSRCQALCYSEWEARRSGLVFGSCDCCSNAPWSH